MNEGKLTNDHYSYGEISQTSNHDIDLSLNKIRDAFITQLRQQYDQKAKLLNDSSHCYLLSHFPNLANEMHQLAEEIWTFTYALKWVRSKNESLPASLNDARIKIDKRFDAIIKVLISENPTDIEAIDKYARNDEWRRK